MVIKTVRMGIPILISRSGFTAWGVELARKANLTLIGRARGKRFVALAGEDRIVFDQDLAAVEEESAKHRRKAAVHDESECFRGTMTDIPSTHLGLVLAGGLARRMGGSDKARIRIGGVTILERVLARLSAQCQTSSSTPMATRPASPTPAAGGARQRAGFRRPARRHPRRARLGGGARHRVEWLVSVPGDCPFLPDDLVERLHGPRRLAAGVPLACARSGEWRHPVVGLWPVALRDDMRAALVDEDLHKIEVWTARHGVAIAEWPAEPVDPFFNVNTPEEVEGPSVLRRSIAII